VAEANLDAQLDARRMVTVPEYEAIEQLRASYVEGRDYEIDKRGPEGHYDEVYAGKGLCVLDGVSGWERRYRIS
jgi:hydroxymethylglutaryl-CoA synthase